MRPEKLAAKLGISGKTLRAWLRRTYPRKPVLKGVSWILTDEQIQAARARWGPRNVARQSSPSQQSRPDVMKSRSSSDEAYVMDLCDEILDERGLRQHRFSWLLGDPGQNRRRTSLPVDAYYPEQNLVVEYRERQHYEAVPFFDRRQTVSGVGRGDQRRLYDERREFEIPRHGLTLVVIKSSDLDADDRGRLRRNWGADIDALRRLIRSAGLTA